MGAANPGFGIGRDRRCTWHGAYGGAASAGTEMRSGGLRSFSRNQTSGQRQGWLHSQRHTGEAASNARAPESEADAIPPGREPSDGTPAPDQRSGASGGRDSARLDREWKPVFLLSIQVLVRSRTDRPWGRCRKGRADALGAAQQSGIGWTEHCRSYGRRPRGSWMGSILNAASEGTSEDVAAELRGLLRRST